MVAWAHSLSGGMTHRDFMRIADPLLKARNYTRTELLGMEQGEISDAIEQLVETEEAIAAHWKRRR